jgi:hypothetical protein
MTICLWYLDCAERRPFRSGQVGIAEGVGQAPLPVFIPTIMKLELCRVELSPSYQRVSFLRIDAQADVDIGQGH